MNINWLKPDIRPELGEYFENDFTKKYFGEVGLVFDTDEELIRFLESGSLKSIDLKNLNKNNTVNITITKEEFERELSDPEYKKSFDAMEDALSRQGTLAMPAPIMINFSGKLYGFAGNRRINLAMKHNIPLKAWVVNVTVKMSSIDAFLAWL